MKKTFIIFFIIITSILPTKSINLGNGLLWEISGNSLKRPSYIFGTHHLFPKEFLDSIQGFNKAFNNVERVVGELNKEDLSKINTESMKYLISAKMPVDTSYRDIFTKKDLFQVDSILSEYFNCKSDNFHSRPKIAYIFISQLIMLNLQYPDKHYLKETLDGFIVNKANLKGIETIGLETCNEQMQIVYGKNLNLSSETKQLINFIHYIPDYTLLCKQHLNAYRNQDLNLLETIYNKIEKLNKQKNDIASCQDDNVNSLKNRNLRWMTKLPKIITEKPTMIAVGVSHLTGEFGLINLFRKLGYKVEPVKK
jgi:uncharacterized protein YbaP (TraB family)